MWCSPKARPPIANDLAFINRFWGKVAVRTKDKCWNWLGSSKITKMGYGIIKNRQINYVAHRVSWEIHYGTIPDDLLVCHTCDNPRCVNPQHLFLGTIRDNIQDMWKKNRGYVVGLGRQIGVAALAASNPEEFQGEKNGNARLTLEDVLEIRKRFKSRHSLGRLGTGVGWISNAKQLATEFGVSTIHIRRIINRKMWKHV